MCVEKIFVNADRSKMAGINLIELAVIKPIKSDII